MNKKISSEVAIVIIFLVSVVFGASIYFSGKSGKIDNIETKTVASIQQSKVETKTKDIVEIPDSIRNKCKKIECMPDCLDGWSETCFYNGNINKESDFKLGFKVEPKKLCLGINFVSVCGNCENKFEIKEGEQFIEVSCEEFYQKIENKNKECENCIKEIMTAS